MIRSIVLFCLLIISKLGLCQSITDADGNVYSSVEIGTQIWLNSNLKTTHFLNGDAIPTTLNCGESIASEYKATYQWIYNCDDSLLPIYGRLYTWYVTVDERKVCPAGFHVPSLAEFMILQNYLGGPAISGGKLKVVGFDYWNPPNTGATNEYGYNGVPNGNRNLGGYYNGLGEVSDTWSTTEAVLGARDFDMHYNDAITVSYDDNKEFAFAIRCLSDKSVSNDLSLISFYPNPSLNELIIDTKINQNTTFEIIALNGEIVQRGYLTVGINNISISDLPSGFYAIKFLDEINTTVYKIIKL